MLWYNCWRPTVNQSYNAIDIQYQILCVAKQPVTALRERIPISKKKKKDSESGSLISLCGCLHAVCIIHADQGFSLHPLTLNGLAPLWPLCGRGRFKAPGGTVVTSLKKLLVKINVFTNNPPPPPVTRPISEGCCSYFEDHFCRRHMELIYYIQYMLLET